MTTALAECLACGITTTSNRVTTHNAAGVTVRLCEVCEDE